MIVITFIFSLILFLGLLVVFIIGFRDEKNDLNIRRNRADIMRSRIEGPRK